MIKRYMSSNASLNLGPLNAKSGCPKSQLRLERQTMQHWVVSPVAHYNAFEISLISNVERHCSSDLLSNRPKCTSPLTLQRLPSDELTPSLYFARNAFFPRKFLTHTLSEQLSRLGQVISERESTIGVVESSP